MSRCKSLKSKVKRNEEKVVFCLAVELPMSNREELNAKYL